MVRTAELTRPQLKLNKLIYDSDNIKNSNNLKIQHKMKIKTPRHGFDTTKHHKLNFLITSYRIGVIRIRTEKTQLTKNCVWT